MSMLSLSLTVSEQDKEEQEETKKDDDGGGGYQSMTKKVYVCFLTTGRYSDTKFQVTKVFTDEVKAKEYTNIINERNEKCEDLEMKYHRDPEKKIAFENPIYSKHKQVDIDNMRNELESKKQKIIEQYRLKIIETYAQFIQHREIHEIDDYEGLIAGYTEREIIGE